MINGMIAHEARDNPNDPADRLREELRKSLQRNTELEEKIRKLEDQIEQLALDVRFYRQQWQD